MLKKVILITIPILAIISIGLFIVILFFKKEEEEIQPRDVTVELGYELTTKIEDYLKNSDIDYHKYTLDNHKYRDKAGKYSYVISKKKKNLIEN